MAIPRTTHADIEQKLLALLAARAPASLCPSDVARAFVEHEAGWRALMPAVREVAVRLAHHGAVSITRSGRTLAPDSIEGGPIRIIPRGPACN